MTALSIEHRNHAPTVTAGRTRASHVAAARRLRARPDGPGTQPTELVSTQSVPPAHAFDLWHSVVSQAFVPLEVRPAGPGAFRGELLSQSVGQTRICRITADAHHVIRNRRLIALGEGDHYKVALQLRGRGRVTQDGREATLEPGDLTVYDTTRPYTLTFDDAFQTLVLMVPRDRLTIGKEQMRQLTAGRICGREGIGSLVSPMLQQLARLMPGGELPLSRRLAQNILDLLETLYYDRLDTPSECPETLRRSRLLAVQSWIDRHLDTPELYPEIIAAANHISVRYLHRLFQQEGTTVSRWTKERRLERCRQDLADPGYGRHGVSAIAARWGFLDAASFSRAFRSAYGQSPREYRAQAAPQPAARLQMIEPA